MAHAVVQPSRRVRVDCMLHVATPSHFRTYTVHVYVLSISRSRLYETCRQITTKRGNTCSGQSSLRDFSPDQLQYNTNKHRTPPVLLQCLLHNKYTIFN